MKFEIIINLRLFLKLLITLLKVSVLDAYNI